MKRNNRILIVDDNRDLHSVLHLALVNKGRHSEHESQATDSSSYEIDSAYSGEEAYEKVKEALRSHKPYAVILMDMRMPPGWDGLETSKKIFEIFPDTEIAIITAYSDFSQQEVFAQINHTDHLQFKKKPFTLKEIKELIQNLLKKWNTEHQVDLSKPLLEG